ncbi:MAG: 3'-5' exonuclease [Magnetococcales bacterium]|nr:3'-5' exonuclease [Magnetococcales bacterium]NGZ26048.1 3'-5' exonuclease [Magnetococcales bacterium]
MIPLRLWQSLCRSMRCGLFKRETTGLGAPLDSRRMVVLDVETTGIRPEHDQVISIGAVVIEELRINFSECFDVVLKQEKASPKENILFHGIGAETQLQGVPPEEGLRDLLEFIGQDPLVAFHAAFDEFMIGKALKQHMQTCLTNPWLDLSRIATALYPDKAGRLRSLDEWSRFFSIQNHQRHHAVDDAFTTAQIGLILIKAAIRQGNHNFADLMALDRDQRWLSARV